MDIFFSTLSKSTILSNQYKHIASIFKSFLTYIRTVEYSLLFSSIYWNFDEQMYLQQLKST